MPEQGRPLAPFVVGIAIKTIFTPNVIFVYISSHFALIHLRVY